MPVEEIRCGDFTAVIDWAGRIYSTVCYEVRVRVTSLAHANAALAAIRETIAREKHADRNQRPRALLSRRSICQGGNQSFRCGGDMTRNHGSIKCPDCIQCVECGLMVHLNKPKSYAALSE